MHSKPRERLSAAVELPSKWRLRTPTIKPAALTPSQVPPARRSRPAMIFGVVAIRLGAADGRS